MYKYISSIVKPNTPASRRRHAELENSVLKNVFREFDKVFVTVFSDELEKNLVIDLDSIPIEYRTSSITIKDFLIQNANKTLTPTDTYPSLSDQYVRYADIWHAGYKVSPISRNANINAPLTDADKTDIILQKEDLDYSVFYKNCLVSVNGLFHLTDYDTSGVYVHNANVSRRLCGKNRVGVYSFKEIGELDFIPIKEDMLFKFGDDIPFKTRFQLKLPKPIGNKTPLVVIGGYLHVLDKTSYRVLNDDTLSIEFLNIPFIERYYESMNRINLSSLGLDYYSRNSSQIDLEQFYSDEVIARYMTLSQSFVILVDNDSMYVDRAHLELSRLSGMAMTTRKPDLPIITNYGQVTEYWYSYEDSKYSVRYLDSERKEYLIRTTEESDLATATNELVGYSPSTQAQAYFLIIGSDAQRIK